jgi:hypothetical protein
MSPGQVERIEKTRGARFFALSLVASLALIEPALGRLEKLGDTIEAKQYLLIAPTGEVAYLCPALREVPIRALTLLAIPLFMLGLYPAGRRLRREGLDLLSAVGWTLVATGLGLLVGEYASKGEWVLLRRVGMRYLALAMLSVGAFLGCRDRAYLSALGLGGFSWDLSSAIFWAALNRSPKANVPVPWYHHFEQEEAGGAPCWLVACVDLAALAYFAWVGRTDYDPFRVFVG